MAEQDNIAKKVEHIEKLIDATDNNLQKIRELLNNLRNEQEKDKYRDVEGIEGKFDGFNLVAEDGTTYEVPGNYAAKSRLVFGDKLKMVEEDGKSVFKQIDKISRKKIEGILSKKEGKWFILADSGSYRVSDVAAEFNNAELNDEAFAFIPTDNLTAPFAALDKIVKRAPPVSSSPQKPVDPKPVAKKSAPAHQRKPVPAKSNSPKKPASSKPKPKTNTTTKPAETVSDITEKAVPPVPTPTKASDFDDDDLR